MDDVKWLMAREIPRLRRYALALINDPEQADDLVQDCLERAIRKRHQWRRHGSIRSWLYRILYSVFVNQSARRNRDRRTLTLEQSPALPSAPAAQEHRLACHDIAEAMARLPAEQRAALALTAIEGLAYDEAAGVLGIPIGTLRSRLARARDTLRTLHEPLPQSAVLRRVK